ncbi:protein kinase [Actinomyces bowdenii]|uniref:serine/threonine-protein kinase n=1 Tax=Actinomyces bowdenii TaxID=131109 RepID=UPI00214C3D18|nr:serine/threonine-protein kinase [Actinomyces bowdenii]MCR2053037.1 protein kinase [Actinomyces bowdenii]
MLEPHGTPPVIAGFTYLSDLGAGGYSTVYLFEQQMPRREVAVKVMNADVEDRTASRFESEANLMARVSSHPAILSIYGAGVSTDGHPFLVMEYCPPPQLGAILREGPLNVPESLSTAIQIAGAVETAHRAGIVHRDIKPANILFTTYRRPVLSDFGISAMSGPEGSEELRGMSVPWAPPEQLVGMRSANPASDVYSLGATTFAMLTGRSPFEFDGVPDVYELSRRIVKDPLPPLGRQDAPPSLHRVLSVAMDKNPDSRYPTALAFARALQQVQAELDLPITTVDLFHEADTAATRSTRTEEDDEATHMGVFSRVEVTSDGIAMRVDDPPAAHSPTSSQYRGREAEEEAELAKPGRLRMVIGGMLVIALVVIIGAMGWAKLRGGTEPPSTFETIAPPAVSPVEAEVAPPTGLEGRVNEDGSVVFTWQAPSEDWSGRYLYRQVIAGQDTPLESTKDTSVTVEGDLGRTCLEVYSLREDGKSSSSVTACVEG